MQKKIIFTVSTLLFLALILLFFWCEDLKTNQRINSEKISHFASIIGSFATLITVYLLYKQVKEMIDGRNSAYRPVLYIDKNQFLTKDLPNPDFKKILRLEENKFPVVGFYKVIQLGDEQKLLPFFLTINIKNIGLGVARNIEIQWVYDIEEVKKCLVGFYDEEQNYPKVDSIDFISVNDSYEIFLPYGYMQLYGQKLNTKLIDIISNSESNEDKKPSICLIVRYKNIYEKSYESTFNINIHAVDDEISITFNEIIKQQY